MSETSQLITESVEHSLELKDGRFLAYHTFPKAEGDSEYPPAEESSGGRKSNSEGERTSSGQRHPVLYFHGFPGCGLEGGIFCARSVASDGGRLYGIDRPGMGRTSSPYTDRDSNVSREEKPLLEATDANGTSNDEKSGSNLDTFVESIWELVEHQGWDEFSIIGVSGGGPYALAMLASYLQRSRGSGPDSRTARLRNVSLVGAICISAGSDGMKTGLDSLVPVVKSAPTSRWSRFQLRAMAVSTGAIFNMLVPLLPMSWVTHLNSRGNKNLPDPDRTWMSDETNVTPFLSVLRSMAVQGGYPGIYDDLMIVLGSGPAYEDILREQYGGKSGDRKDLPAVGIFQGGLDVNVPPSHAKYLHDSIFRGQSEFFEYEDLGHVSTISAKAEEYSAFATAEQI